MGNLAASDAVIKVPSFYKLTSKDLFLRQEKERQNLGKIKRAFEPNPGHGAFITLHSPLRKRHYGSVENRSVFSFYKANVPN